MKLKSIKRMLAFILIVSISIGGVHIFAHTVSAASTAPYDAFNNTSYGRTYTLATSGRQTVYTSSNLKTPGNNRGACNAWIDCAADELWIFDVGVTNGTYWAYVSYPVSSGRRTGYIPLSTITSNTHAVTATATGKFYCAPRKGQANHSSYWVDKGDRISLIAINGDQVQLIYPASGGRYRIAWAKKSDYEKWCGSISGTKPTTSSPKSPIIAEGDYYYIASALNTSMVLDVTNGSTKDGANIQLYKKNATNAQLFRFVKSSKDGYYYIVNKGSGKAIDVQGGGTTSGTNVQQYTRNNTQAQRWVLRCVPGSNDRINIKAQCGKYLDVKNAEAKNGTNIWIYDGNGTNAQQFLLIPYVSHTYRTIRLDFHDVQSWVNAVAKAQRSITFGGNLYTNPSGNTYYNGKIIIGAEVLEYTRLTVKIPTTGPSACQTKTINFPTVIRYKLHTHSDKVKCWFTVSELKFWQSCECGYHDEWSWEVPWPDLTESSDTQTAGKVNNSIQPVWKPLYNVH